MITLDDNLADIQSSASDTTSATQVTWAPSAENTIIEAECAYI